MDAPGYKEIAIISAVIILVLVLLLYPAPEEQTEDTPEAEDQNKSTEENQTQDEPAATDYQKAVLSGDPDSCSNIGDASERNACIAKASDTKLYLEALEARDPSLCADINDTNIRETCEYALTYGINVTANTE